MKKDNTSPLTQLAVALFVILTSTAMLLVAAASGHFTADFAFLIMLFAFFWLVLNRLSEKGEKEYQPVYVENRTRSRAE